MHECKVNFIDRIINVYKEQNAYSYPRYYKSMFFYEALFHEIGPSDEFCFLRGNVIPPQNNIDVPCDCLITINKTTGAMKSAWYSVSLSQLI